MTFISYVYVLTDLSNQKTYIGSRTVKRAGARPLEDIGVKYFTSSKVVAPKFKSNPESFRIDIAFESFSREEVNAREKLMIERADAVQSSDYYNLANWPVINHVEIGLNNYKNGVGIHALSKKERSKTGKILGAKNVKFKVGFLNNDNREEHNKKRVETLKAFKEVPRKAYCLTTGETFKTFSTDLDQGLSSIVFAFLIR